MQEPPHHHSSRIGWISAGGLIVAGAVLIAFRQHAFDLPLETDECNYAYIAARLLEGQRLYVDVWDHQPPGVFVLFAGLIATFGDSPPVFRWTATAFSLLSMALIYGIVRRAAGAWPAAGAALLFAIVSSDPGTGGEGANREIYMNFCVLAAWYCTVRWGVPNREIKDTQFKSAAWLVAAGAALGIGSTIKTILAVHWAGLALCVLLIAATKAAGGRRRRNALVGVLSLGLAPAVLWLLTFGYFAATERWDEFLDAVFRFNVGYSDSGQHFFARFLVFFSPPRHPFIFASALPMWIAALVAVLPLLIASTLTLLASRRMPRQTPAPLLAFGLLISSYLAVCMPGRFWPHYYYLLVPPALIAFTLSAATIGKSIAFLRDRSQDRDTSEAAATTPVRPETGSAAIGILLLAVIAATAFWQYRHYLSQPLFGLTVHRYNSRDFWGRAQGENVARATEPRDEVFVFGNEAEIYYYSGRRCASRYTMITGLADGLPGAEQRRRILLNDLKADPPRLILVLFDVQPWAEWRGFLLEHYGEPVGWDYHDRTRQPIMFVLSRKDHPIAAVDWNWDRASVGGWHLGDERR